MKKFLAPLLSTLLLISTILAFGFIIERIGHFVFLTSFAREEVRVSTARLEAFNGSSAFLQKTSALRTELRSLFIQENNSVRLIESVEDAAARARVKVSVSSVSALPTAWQYHESVRVIASGTGTLAALSRFARELEMLPEASRVASVSLEASTGGLWFGTFAVDFVKEK